MISIFTLSRVQKKKERERDLKREGKGIAAMTLSLPSGVKAEGVFWTP